MPIRKWIIQYSIALPLLFALFAGVQYFKGQTLTYSLSFGAIWSVIALSLFAFRRAYNFRKNIACQLCNDLPDASSEDK